MNRDSAEEIREAVRSRYGEIAMKGGGCGCSSSACCSEPMTPLENHSIGMGYSPDEVKGVPEGANMGLGCGNPSALDVNVIKKKAYSHFESRLHCAEVVSKAILEAFSEEASAEAIRCASGFGGGIAGSMEDVCGAFTGGVVALGYLLGRDNPGDSLKACAALTRKFKSRFLEAFGSIDCPEITRGFREQKNALGCVKLTGKATAILADLLKEFAAENSLDLSSHSRQPRERIKVGSCPFSAG